MTEPPRGTGTPTQQKKLGTGGRESDVDEVRQPTKTVPRTIPEEEGPIPLHRDTTILLPCTVCRHRRGPCHWIGALHAGPLLVFNPWREIHHARAAALGAGGGARGGAKGAGPPG